MGQSRSVQPRASRRSVEGQVCGRWTIIGDDEDRNGQRRVICKCVCGTVKTSYLSNLLYGASTRCKHCPRPTTQVPLEGVRYGKLIVVRQVFPKVHNMGRWECLCDCGNTTIVLRSNLPRTSSCGCGLRTYEDPSQSSLNEMIYAYQNNSKARGLEFALTAEEFRGITSSNCAYCGCSPCQDYRPRRKGMTTIPYRHNGIDRVDNSKGYVSGNCVSACFICNRMKFKFSADEFQDHISRIHRHLSATR